MITEESPDVTTSVEQPAPARALNAAETLARALGTAPASDPPAPPAETGESENDVTD